MPDNTAATYEPDPLRPATPGWCEAITHTAERCYTRARFERDGIRVCGMHLHAKFIVTHVKGL